jgi:hypothetical protein
MAIRPGSARGFGLRPKNRWESLFELVVLMLFIAWWTGLMPWSVSIWVSDNVRIEPGPVLLSLYWVVLAVAAVQAAAAAIRFVEPRRSRLGATVDLASAVAGIALAVALLPDPAHIVQFDVPRASVEQIQKVYVTLSTVMRIALLAAIAGLTVQAIQAGWRMVVRPEAGPGAVS